ncbi:MAG: polymorphic toxin type 50 domain-containing protein [bacterium]
MSIGKERLEKILAEKTGKGQKIKSSIPYSPGYKERVNFGELIGEYVKLNEKGEIIRVAPTTKGIIHYSKKGIHVVPSDPHARMK